MSSFAKLKGMAGASVIAGVGLAGMMASSARAGVKTSWTSSTGGYLTFHDAGKDWAHGFYFNGSSTATITSYYSSVSEGAIGRTASCTASVTTFWQCYSYSDAYDGVLGMSVNGNGFAPVTANVVVSDYSIDAGSNVDIDTDLDASVRWDFLANRPVTRGLFSVTNKAAITSTVTVSVWGDWGADSSGGIVDTSNGDTTVDNSDRWVTISDNLTDGSNSDPVIITGIQGPGASVTGRAVSLNTGSYNIEYTFDIPAGETRSVLVLHEMSKSITDADGLEADYADGKSLAKAGLLAGLTNVERGQVVNYDLPKKASSSDGGSAGAMFMALLGLLGVSRLRRKH